MLPPLRIGHVDAVGGFVLLLLEGGEEFVDQALLGPVAEGVGQGADHQDRAHDGNDELFALARSRLVVFLRIQQRHTLLG